MRELDGDSLANDRGARLCVLLAREDGTEEVICEVDLTELLPELMSGELALFDEKGNQVEGPAQTIAFALEERLEDALRLDARENVRVEVRLADGERREVGLPHA